MMFTPGQPRKPKGANRHGYRPFPGYEWLGSNPGIFGGKPIIDGVRFALAQLLEAIATGATPEEILENFPELPVPECIPEAIRFAVWAIDRQCDVDSWIETDLIRDRNTPTSD